MNGTVGGAFDGKILFVVTMISGVLSKNCLSSPLKLWISIFWHPAFRWWNFNVCLHRSRGQSLRLPVFHRKTKTTSASVVENLAEVVQKSVYSSMVKSVEISALSPMNSRPFSPSIRNSMMKLQ